MDEEDSFEAFVKHKKTQLVVESLEPHVVVDEKQHKSFESKLLMSDDEILALGVRPSDVEQFRRMRYQDSFGISSWYDALKEKTFPSSFLPLSYQQGRAIYDVHLLKAQPTEDQKKEFSLLEKLLDDAIGGRQVFIKLNTRSPKDVPVYDFDNPRVQRAVDESLLEVVKKSPAMEPLVLQNLQVAAFVKATQQCLKISSGKEALDLLLRSQRVSEDLSKALRFSPELWQVHIVIREWDDYVVCNPQGEFRCFVHNNRLNAVTQYYSFCVFPEVVERKDELKKCLQQFFDTHIRDVFVTHGSYIFDVWVGGFEDKKKPLEMLVIELNPFHIGAGAGLFSWKTDRELFLNGPKDTSLLFELRLCTEIEKDPFEVLPIQWRRYIEQKEKEVEQQKNGCILF